MHLDVQVPRMPQPHLLLPVRDFCPINFLRRMKFMCLGHLHRGWCSRCDGSQSLLPWWVFGPPKYRHLLCPHFDCGCDTIAHCLCHRLCKCCCVRPLPCASVFRSRYRCCWRRWSCCYRCMDCWRGCFGCYRNACACMWYRVNVCRCFYGRILVII